MERKEQCERIVLTKKEKELLKQIQKNPGMKCNQDDVWQLYLYGLIRPMKTEKGLNMHHFHIADFYDTYRDYQREKRKNQFFESLWLPIAVSVVTNLAINGLQWLWPLLVQWCASSHQ